MFRYDAATVAAIKWHGPAFDEMGYKNVVKRGEVADGRVRIVSDRWQYGRGH